MSAEVMQACLRSRISICVMVGSTNSFNGANLRMIKNAKIILFMQMNSR